MKKVYILLTGIIIAAMFLVSCGGLKKMLDNASTVKFEANPKVLEMNGGFVNFTLTGTFPAEYFDRSALITLTPCLKYNGIEKNLDPIVLQGEDVQANNKVINYLTGGQFSQTFKVAYEDGMKSDSLILKISAKVKDETVNVPSVKVALGTITTCQLIQPIGDADASNTNTNVGATYAGATSANYILANFIPQTQMSKSIFADIHYKISDATVQPSELKQEDIKTLESFVKENATNAGITISGLGISGYASPDGPVALNEKLSKQRAASAEKSLTKLFKEAKFDKASNAGFFSTVMTAVDWDGFRKAVEASSIADKDLIIRVLEKTSDPDARNKEIKSMTAAFNVLKTSVLPILRRSDLSLNAVTAGHSDDEIKNLAQTNPSALNPDELLKAATLVDDMDTKGKLYQAAATKDAKDWRALNNLAYVYYKQGKYSDAYTTLRSAEALDPGNQTILYNLGIVTYANKQTTEANNYFNTASTVSQSSNQANPSASASTTTASQTVTDAAKSNIATMSLQSGDYTNAVQQFGDLCVFNAALAKVLAKDYAGATKTLDCIKDAALNFYLRAIIGARTDVSSMVFDNLRTAISKDATLKAKAKTDAEFIKYFADATFLLIVQ